MLKKVLKQFSVNKHLSLILLFGSLSWVLTMIKNGLTTFWGYGFWGANGHDAIWHLALSNSLSRGSLNMPTFSGVPLQNYHLGFDLLLAFLSKTGISTSVWYFQILPIVFSLLIGILTYIFVYEWKKSRSAANWATFFVYFGGSFGWIVTIIRGQGIGGESMFWAQQGISTLINPPFALSLIFLLLGLIFLQKFITNRNKWHLLIAAPLFGLLIEVKAYAGVLVLISFGLSTLYYILFERKSNNYKYISKLLILSLILAGTVSLLLIRLLIKTSGDVFAFQPFWFLETLLALSDRFYWPKLYEAILNWRSGHIYIKALIGYAVAFLIFVVGNFGTRLTGLMQKEIFLKRRIEFIDVLLLSILSGGILAPLLFVQSGTPWNTIQFFYYSLFILSLYAGVSVSTYVTKKNLSYLIILLTIPTSLSTLLTVYLPPRPPASLPASEISALNFLKSTSDGVVLTYPFDMFKAKEAIANPPRPLYLYDSTAYVSAFSNHPVFLEDEVNLSIMGYQWKERRTEIEKFYNSQDQVYTRNFLKQNNIKYIYWVKPQRAVLGDAQLRLENIYENNEVIIYRVIQ